MINHIQTYVMAHRSVPNRLLMKWLTAWQPDWKQGSQVGFRIDLARNQTVNAFLKDDVPRGKTHLLLLDADMVPVISTNKIIPTHGDLVFSEYVGRSGVHGHRTSPGAGCVKVSADLLGKMVKPYFCVPVNETCDLLEGCECDYFYRNAIKAGATAIKAGMIGHQMGGNGGCVIFPANTASGFRAAWPEELGYDSSPILADHNEKKS